MSELIPPRRDEIATGATGAFSQRSIQYLEDLATTTNEIPAQIDEKILSEAGALSGPGIATNAGDIHQLKKIISDQQNIIAQQESKINQLISMLNNLSNSQTDILNQIVPGININPSITDNIIKRIMDLENQVAGI